MPTTVTSLSDITSGTLSPEHLPGTISPNVNITRSPVIPTPSGPGSRIPTENRPCWDSGVSGRLGGLGIGEGEWERQGLGKGLEQRLEDLVSGQNKDSDASM